MKIKICALILLLFSMPLYSQKEESSRKVELGDGSFVIPDKYPEVTKHVKPEYPRQAILQDIQGKVYVKVTIKETGKVEGVKIAYGINSSIDKAAMAAAKKMEFSPAIYKGKAVKVSIAVPINFILDPEKQGPKISMIGPPPSQVNQIPERKDTVNIQQDRKLIQKTGGDDNPDPSVFIPVEKNPEPIKLVKPYYPEIAQRAGLTGVVILRVLVSKEGKPIKVALIKADNDIFVEPSKKAAMETLFTPATQGGKPITCWLNIPFKFTLGTDNTSTNRSYNVVILAGTGEDKYPPKLSDTGIEGVVGLSAKYTLDGVYISSEIVKATNTELDQLAVSAIKSEAFNKSKANKRTVDGTEYYFINYNVMYSIPKREKVIFYPEDPEYPQLAAKAGIEGLVEVEFTYDLKGQLVNKEITKKTNTILDEAALKLMETGKIPPKGSKKIAADDGIKIVVTKAVEYRLKKK